MSSEHSPEEIPEVIPVPEPPRHRRVCPHCGSDDIATGLKIGQTADAAEIGVTYEATGRFLGVAFLGNEPLRLDLCNACGTVTRLYVGKTDRKWNEGHRGIQAK
jgi:hypothetical protein